MMGSDWKCAITTAILSVLIYLIIVNIFGTKENKVGKSMNDEGVNWYESVEIIMLISVIIGFSLNGVLFQSCSV
jgi:hypothetical protein